MALFHSQTRSYDKLDVEYSIKLNFKVHRFI